MVYSGNESIRRKSSRVLSDSHPPPYPFPALIEHAGDHRRRGPAHRPGQPDPGGTQGRDRRKGKGQDHPQHQIREGRRHELPHGPGPPKDSVRHQLHGHHKIERGHDPKKLRPGGKSRSCAGILRKEQADHGAPKEEKSDGKGHGDQEGQPDPRPKPLLHPAALPRPHVLGRKAGETVGQGRKGRDREGIQLDGRRVSGDDG